MQKMHLRPQKISMKHLVVELAEVPPCLINSVEKLDPTLKFFCQEIGLKVIGEKIHKFTPQGLTIVYILTNSHLAFHSWPELGYAHLDLITCGSNLDLARINQLIILLFSTVDYHILEIRY